ncbi:MAG: helix-turn-helix domain-containing protein [Planctomyces sp.]|jgi:excisionase family DNA binding protein|nr:helix-turn-helix domain-containing protein [Planctomyces sp.]
MTTQLTNQALMSARQVAELLNISTRTLWRLKSAGRLPAAIRIGKSIRWRREDLNTWIEEGCQTPISTDNVPRRKG